MKTFITCIVICFTIPLGGALVPIQYRNQEKLFHKGTPFLISSKKVSDVRLVPLDHAILQNKASFSFSIANRSSQKLNFLADNLTAYDQDDREIVIVPKQELIHQSSAHAWWRKLFSNITYWIELWYSPEYGFLGYSSNYRHRKHLYSRGLVKQAQDIAALKEDRRQEKILYLEDSQISGYEEFYFGSHTIFPDDFYSANIQIKVPDDQLEELQFLYINFDVGGEQHIFCLQYTKDESSSWWSYFYFD